MRTRTASRYLALLVLPLLVLAGCGPAETVEEDPPQEAQEEAATAVAGEEAAAEEADPLEGEYTMPSGARVVVEDGTYTVYDGDEVMVVGNYMYEGDQVIFVDSGGPEACSSDMRGVYTLGVDEANEPSLSLVEDPCEGRRRDITGEAYEEEEGDGEEHQEH